VPGSKIRLELKYKPTLFARWVLLYAYIDNTKIATQLGWKPKCTFEEGIKETIQWYLDNTEWIENIVSGDYVKYYEEMYGGIGEVAAGKTVW